MSHHNLLTPTTNIPLHCNICPKKPDFSDVSHLLTHVASKGHLSNYYKMKVKAGTDPESKQIVDEYDEWYEDWNLQDLMRERMSQKEKKKGGANGNVNSGANSRRGSAANSVTSAKSRNTPVIGMPNGRHANPLRANMLDPQLGPRIKLEPKSRSTTPAPPFMLDPAAAHRLYAPPMQNWPATPFVDSPMSQERSVLDSLYSTPSSDSPDFELPKRGSARNKRRNLSGSNESYLVDDDLEFDDGQNQNTKLKGVYWDGMGMFDSATPEMRRKRNQKKSTSVVLQLKATSDVVEPKECVFDSEGDCVREREITGNPNEDDGFSPLKGEASPELESPVKPKKKTSRRPRQALAEKEVNTGRVLRRRGESHHPPFGNSNKRGPYFDGGEEDDDRLTYGGPLPRKRVGLSIHRDNSGPEITFNSPAPLSTLTSGFRNSFQPAALQSHGRATHQNDFIDRNHQRQPSFPFGSGHRQPISNPLNGIPPLNFGSFGQLSGQSMLQSANLNNNHPFAPSNGQQAFAAFQQTYGIGQQPLGNDNSFFQGQNNNGVHANNPWDFLGLGQQDMSFANSMDVGFNVGTDFTSMNPLFFSSNKAGPEDDEATISPPASDH